MNDAPTIARLPALRLRDWQPRLAQLLAQRMQQPLCWGVHDCCLFAADAVQAVTGVDLAADLRGTYATEAEAAAVLAQHGGLVGLCVSRLGRVVPAALAQAGDVGIAHQGQVHGLVVCGGGHFLAVGAAGLVPVPVGQVLRAWRCTSAGEGGARG